MIDLTVLLTIIGALTVVTNLVTEVLKKAWKIPANILAVATAEVLTLVSFFAWADIKSVPILWYSVVGAAVTGLLVSYAAMFGFDKLKETLLRLKEAK